MSTPRVNASSYKKNRIHRKNTELSPSSKYLVIDSDIGKEAFQVFHQVQSNRRNFINSRSENAFYTKTTVKTRKFDKNGKEIIEKFESTAFGGFSNDGQQIAEISQQYVNEDSGTQKILLQRILGNKRKQIQAKRTLDLETCEVISENAGNEFDKEWETKAKVLGNKKTSEFEQKFKSLSNGL